MLDVAPATRRSGAADGPRLDLQEHLATLEAKGLLVRIDRPINKDTELHPLVRWQFHGRHSGRRAQGLPVHQRRRSARPPLRHAGGGRRARASPRDLCARHGARRSTRSAPPGCDAIAHPIAPVLVDDAALPGSRDHAATICASPAADSAALPVPISTPGFDAAPYLTATLCITRDPETGVRNMGTYRAALKATDRLGVRMASRARRRRRLSALAANTASGKEPMPCAIVIGCAPAVVFTGPQKLADRSRRDGGRRRARRRADPHRRKCVTIDLEVPADAEIVIEGLIDPELLEPEGPFGESHGHVALEDYNMSMQVTAITHQRSAGVRLDHQPGDAERIERDQEGRLRADVPRASARPARRSRAFARVVMHEPLTNLRPVIFLQFAHGAPRTRSLARRCTAPRRLQADCGKIVHRGQRGHRSRQYRCGVLVDRLSREPDRGSACRALSRGGHGPKSRPRQQRFDAADRRHAEAADAAAGAARRANTWSRRAASGKSCGLPRCRRSRPGTAIRSATGTTPGTPLRAAPSRATGTRMAGDVRAPPRRAHAGNAGARGGRQVQAGSKDHRGWYAEKMTKEQFNAVLEDARSWPEEESCRSWTGNAREIQARRTGVYIMTDEERAAVREGLEQARRGEFVPDDEMDAFWKKIGVPMRVQYTPHAPAG